MMKLVMLKHKTSLFTILDGVTKCSQSLTLTPKVTILANSKDKKCPAPNLGRDLHSIWCVTDMLNSFWQ